MGEIPSNHQKLLAQTKNIAISVASIVTFCYYIFIKVNNYTEISIMSTAALSSLDFKAIARQVPNAKPAQSSNELQGDELIPTEARSRMSREGRSFMRRPAVNGATVDQEGLTNNYAVEPELYYALFPSPEQAREYALQAGLSVLFVTSIVFTAFAVS